METLNFLGKNLPPSNEAIGGYHGLPIQGWEIQSGVAAIIPRSADPNDDLVVYEEKADRATIDWILRLSRRK